jgi:hypothetical protein
LPTSQDHLKLAKQAQADSMASLSRSAKLVEDTTVNHLLRFKAAIVVSFAGRLTLLLQALGTETAVKLHAQTEQMKNIYSTVSELDSELGRANKVLRGFLRGAMTDKLTLCFILLLVCAVISVIAVKVVQGQQSSSSNPAPAPAPAPPPDTPAPSPPASSPPALSVLMYGNKMS